MNVNRIERELTRILKDVQAEGGYDDGATISSDTCPLDDLEGLRQSSHPASRARARSRSWSALRKGAAREQRLRFRKDEADSQADRREVPGQAPQEGGSRMSDLNEMEEIKQIVASRLREARNLSLIHI